MAEDSRASDKNVQNKSYQYVRDVYQATMSLFFFFTGQ